MNSINTDENNNTANSRPFGFWLKAVDRLMAAEFASAFDSEGITRREWRLLNVIDGTAPSGHPKSDRPSQPRKLPAHKLARLIELGWVTDADGTWTLTDEGRTAKERLGSVVEGIRAKVTDAVPAEDLATTIATLEQLARAFGWDEETPLPRGRGHRGFGHRHGFGRHGHGHSHSHDHSHEGCRHGERGFVHDTNHENHRPHPHGGPHDHRGHARARFAHFAQGAYERGFDSGFSRGRDDR
ncbi:MarR family winged helix-turn-helix transcriptional regulator [Microbacterium sp. A93]|uniref:MarR family winged helix-turn-helix transcriptional regulator n=1 Tax=Microbacterium sp. A93 TaxID=3450716 RepID=UPI003F42D4B9